MVLVVAMPAVAGCGPRPSGGSETAAATPSPDEVERLALQAVPYLQAYRRAEDRPLIGRYDREAAFDGLNLYASGHAAEATLMDMHGRVKHRWRYPLRRAFPDLASRPNLAKVDAWRHVQLLPDGGLLAIYGGLGVVALDRGSRLLWSYQGGVHHDLYVDDAGNVHVLERRPRMMPALSRRRQVLDDYVTTFDPQGRVLGRWSVLDAIGRSPYAPMLDALPRRHGDVLHTNALELLAGRHAAVHPAFRGGNLLISLRQLDAIAVLDPRTKAMVWALEGSWRRQHAPSLVEQGRVLLFDNRGPGEDRSRVVEVDPRDGSIAWQYGGDSPGTMSSRTLGLVQRLPNGNTLITDSHQGRAVEVDRGGRVVWEFYNPHRLGERGEMVAALYELQRLPVDLPFLDAPAAGDGARRSQ